MSRSDAARTSDALLPPSRHARNPAGAAKHCAVTHRRATGGDSTAYHWPVRFAGSVVRECRPFGRGWWFLAAVSVVLLIGAGGGTPKGAPWLIGKFAILGVLLASLVVSLLAIVKDGVVRRRRFARRTADPS